MYAKRAGSLGHMVTGQPPAVTDAIPKNNLKSCHYTCPYHLQTLHYNLIFRSANRNEESWGHGLLPLHNYLCDSQIFWSFQEKENTGW